jgi:hypothetical protein
MFSQWSAILLKTMIEVAAVRPAIFCIATGHLAMLHGLFVIENYGQYCLTLFCRTLEFLPFGLEILPCGLRGRFRDQFCAGGRFGLEAAPKRRSRRQR